MRRLLLAFVARQCFKLRKKKHKKKQVIALLRVCAFDFHSKVACTQKCTSTSQCAPPPSHTQKTSRVTGQYCSNIIGVSNNLDPDQLIQLDAG